MPDIGAILLAAFPIPDWVPEDLVRLGMLAGAILLPAVLGAVTLLLQDPEDRPKGVDLVKQLARGYAFVPTLAITIVVLAVAGTIRKVDSLVHRRQDAHVAVVVRPGRYDALVDTLEQTLQGGGLTTSRGAGPSVLTMPARILAKVGGGGIGRLVPDRLVELRGPEVKVSIYPADLAITGSKDAVPKARALDRSRRSVTGRLVHDDEGGPEARGRARGARAGGPGRRSPRSCPRWTPGCSTSRSTRRRSRCSTGAGSSSQSRRTRTCAPPRSRRRHGRSPRATRGACPSARPSGSSSPR